MFCPVWNVAMATMIAGASLNVNNIFSKVSNKFPVNDLALCLVEKIDVGNFYRPKVPCITACAKHSSCYLACHNDIVCYLYSATVSIYYNAMNSQYQPTTEVLNGECYSSFVANNDITAKIVSTYVSSTFPENGLVKSLAFDGYYCPAGVYAWVSYFHSNETDGPSWIIADLGMTYKVSKLIVQTRTVWPNHFRNIEVRIGNRNSTGNALWASYPGSAIEGSIVVFQGALPAIGRYVSIIALDFYLVLPEVKIMGYDY